MNVKFKKSKQLIAVTVAALLLLTAVPVAVFSTQSAGDKTEDLNTALYSEEDLKTASDISNMTGVKTEDILAMKKEGKTWNEILDSLKNNKSSGSSGERNGLLSQSGLSESYVEDLKKEGFSDNEITDAKIIAERVLFDLNEIVSAANLQNPVSPLPPNTVTADDSAYTELAGKFDMPSAVTLMLRLKDDFGGTEQVLDEYLFSLQAGLDLSEYIQDKASYKKKRDEKSRMMNTADIITIQKIEEKMLETIQNANKANVNAALPGKSPEGTQDSGDVPKETDNSPIPADILPGNGTKAVRPENPTEKIMDEIKELNPAID